MRKGEAALLVLAVSATCISASVVGTNTAAQSISAERIAKLPRKQQAAWRDYLARSRRQMQADRAALQAELKAAGLAEPLTPPNGFTGRSMPLTKPPEWYGSAEARHVADIIVSFQTPAGGWSKNLNVAGHVRRRAESYAPNNLSRYLAPDDFDTPHDPHWNYVGTLDNDATATELQFLARGVAAVEAKDNVPYRTSFLRGPDGGRLTPASGGKPIWARFYEIGTDRPIFADRDKSIHDNVEELSRERRMGYNWYGSVPQDALDRYAQWSLLDPLR
jgi:hypothetical protein